MPMQSGNIETQRAAPPPAKRSGGTPSRTPSVVAPAFRQNPEKYTPLESMLVGSASQPHDNASSQLLDLLKTQAQPTNFFDAAMAGEPFDMFAEHTATKPPSPPTKPGTFKDDGNVLQQILTPGPNVKAAYDPTAVADARSDLQAALARGNESKPTGLAGARAFTPNPAAVGAARDADAADSRLEEALRAQRAKAIGADSLVPQGPGNISKRLDPMTQAEYDQLAPKQRAAVDFNTMLVDAVRKDLHHGDEYKASSEQRAIYDDSVEKMFGEDRGSATYAPETMAVLKQIGYKDANADLDDFLGLKATIKAGDLDSLVIDTPGPARSATAAEGGNPLQTDRLNLDATLAKSTAQMEKEIANAHALLQSPSITQLLAVERNQDISHMGGIPNNPDARIPGYGSPTDANGEMTLDGYFQSVFDKMSTSKGQGLQTAIANLHTDVDNGVLTEQEYEAFKTYANSRITNSARFGTPLGVDDKADYTPGKVLRNQLDLGPKTFLTGAGPMYPVTQSGNIAQGGE